MMLNGGLRLVMLARPAYAASPAALSSRRFCHSEGSISEQQPYDIVISGGGMVGSAAAAALACCASLGNKRILLLEAENESTFRLTDRYSNRVSALSPSSVRLLTACGAWAIIASQRAKPVTRMYVWDSCSDVNISFAPPSATETLAHIVENDITVSALAEVLRQNKHRVQVSYGTSVRDYKLPKTADNLVGLTLSTGDKILTRLLVAADGYGSLARRSAKIDTCSWAYDQVGVVATLRLDRSAEGNRTAWQRFLPSGPIALLPLSETSSSLVWSTSPQHAKRLLAMSPESFVDAVNQALFSNEQNDWLMEPIIRGARSLLQQIGSVAESTSSLSMPATITGVEEDSLASFPYGLMHATRYVAPRLALVGDACHRIHPLAGQGVNLGFGDVSCLVEKMVKANRLGADIGWIDHLLEYETERQRHVIGIMAGVDGLSRLYNTSLAPVVLVRSLGLMAVNACSPIKKAFMRQAQL